MSPDNSPTSPDSISRRKSGDLHPEVKISLACSRAFYGPGVNQLLLLVQETGSLRHACKSMSLSYSKGLRLIDKIEQVYGHKVIIRQPGGKDGGKSILTAEGEALISRYEAFAKEAQDEVDAVFKKYFE